MNSPVSTDVLAGKFDLVPIDLRDCPVYLMAALPCRTEVTGRRVRIPSGRGLSAGAACESTVGECYELLHSLAQNADRQRLPIEMRDGISYLPVSSLPAGEVRMMPAQDLYLDWAAVFDEPLVHDADSTGCAAGATCEDATERALFECVERDAMAAWWYGRQSRARLDPALLWPQAPRLLWWLNQRPGRRWQLIDVSTDIGIPVVVAASAEDDGRHVAIGAAARATFADAAISAVTEMVQTEVALRAGRGAENQELDAWTQFASIDVLPQFAALKGTAETVEGRHRDVSSAIAARGFRAFAYAFARCDESEPFSLRCMVPGFSAMRRHINAERIVALNRSHPEYGGATRAEDFEKLDPY